MLTTNMNMEEIINESVDKLDVEEFEKFKEWLKQHEKCNFVKGLINFVKDELEKIENDNKENEKSEAILTFDEGDVEIKELIAYLLQSEEREIFRSMNNDKDKKNLVQRIIDYFKCFIRKSRFRDSVLLSIIRSYCNLEKLNEDNEEKAIQLLIDYFMYKWNRDIKNLKFMLVVSNLLPYLVSRSYKILIND